MIRFDEAWERANEFLRQRPELGSSRVVLVRDLHGKVRIALDDRGAEVLSGEERTALAASLALELGAFSPGTSDLFLLASKMFAPDEIFVSPDTLSATPGQQGHRILDRSIIGEDWLREPLGKGPPRNPRVTFYGVKGGVGRSTAMSVLAARLSRAGKRVLVVDLDLESPGVGATLLPDDRIPDFGLADWFVEDAVGQADENLIREMVASSPLGAEGAELLVAPASGRGRQGYSYLSKLARIYVEIGKAAGTTEAFSDRLHRLVEALEAAYHPDVTFLDSRAGLHDIAAVTVTRLQATSLLFAIDTSQTWQAYQALFQVWHTHFDRAERFRENLKMVAAQVPETETTPYLESFQERSYDLFQRHLYTETLPGEADIFNFDYNDPDAPHSPLRVHWSRSFQQYDPVRRPDAVTETQVQAAYGDFVKGASLLVFGESFE